jgi:DNA-binding NarL/FixJ family response regulator
VDRRWCSIPSPTCSSSKQIAETLVISERGVERHRSNSFAKLGLTDRVALTRYAFRRGLIEP